MISLRQVKRCNPGHRHGTSGDPDGYSTIIFVAYLGDASLREGVYLFLYSRLRARWSARCWSSPSARGERGKQAATVRVQQTVVACDVDQGVEIRVAINPKLQVVRRGGKR